MRAVKRVEVVVESVHEHAVAKLIDQAGADGYTLLRNVVGHGERGERDAQGLTGVFRNVCFIVAVDPDQAETLAESVRPLLRDYGGLCLVSDAQRVDH